jgi:hypothetical protein
MMERSHPYLAPLFLDTFGSWQGDRSADEIIDDIYANRFTSEKDLSG